MSLKNSNVAYDLSLFEEEKTRKSNVLEISRMRIIKRKRKLKKISFRAKVISFTVFCLFSVGSIIFNQVQLTELTDKISIKNQELKEKASLYTQMEVKRNKNFSTDKIENLAKNLNMQKADSSQIEYIDVHK